jgi:hypothetical protein
VIAEVIVLALISTVRPTSLAAVYALVSAQEPRRLMISYVVTGLVFTVGFGMLVIWAFHGLQLNSGTNRTKGIADIAGGIIVLAFALSVATGRVGGPRPADAPKAPGRWDKLKEHRLTPRVAALAGPATHIPGIFYLIALNVIVADNPKVGEGLVAVLIYNVIWFAVPIIALVLCIVDPDTARAMVGAIDAWTKRHARTIVAVVSCGVGAGLVVRGALTV